MLGSTTVFRAIFVTYDDISNHHIRCEKVVKVVSTQSRQAIEWKAQGMMIVLQEIPKATGGSTINGFFINLKK